MNIKQAPNVKAKSLQLSIMDVLGTKVKITWTPIIFNKTYFIYYYEKDKENVTTKKIAFTPPKGTLFYTIGEKSNEILRRGIVYYFYVTYNGAKSNSVPTTILHYPVKWGKVFGYDTDNGIDIYSNGACEKNKNSGGIECKDYFNRKNDNISGSRIKDNNYRYITMIDMVKKNTPSEETPCLAKILACGPGKIIVRRISDAWVPAGRVGAEDEHRGHGSWCFVTQELDKPIYYKAKEYKFVWYMHLHFCYKIDKDGTIIIVNKDHEITEMKEIGKNPDYPDLIGYNMYASLDKFKNISNTIKLKSNGAHLHFGIAADKKRTDALDYKKACEVLGVKHNQIISR